MSNSFYGGRDGAPMVIKQHYKTILDMVNDFENIQNSNLAFGDHVIIQSENKNNPENGRIFRRGLDVNSGRTIKHWTKNKDTNIYESTDINARGAALVGQIVGPSGNAPHLHLLSTIDEVKGKYHGYYENIETALRNDVALKNRISKQIREKLIEENNKKNEEEKLSSEALEELIAATIEIEYEATIQKHLKNYSAYGPGYDIKIEEGVRTASVGLDNLVPGKYVDEDGNKQFNDEIKWLSCSVRDENQQETDAYIGFEIPYTVIEWDAHSEDPYYNRNNNTNDFINTNLITRHDDDKEAKHPFYQKWQIHIPKGIHGQSIKSIEVISANANLVKLTYNEDEEKTLARDENGKLITEPYADATTMNDDIQNARLVIACNFIDYDRIPQGEPYAVYLGDYNMIDSIELADDGTFTIDYSHDDNYVKGINTGENGEDERLTWITGASLDVETGSLDVETNNDTKEIHKNLTWVKNLTIGDTGLLNTITTTGDNQIEDQQLHWIEDIKINPEDGTVTYTDVSVNENGNKNTRNDILQWVKNIDINKDTGVITVSFTGEKEDEIKPSLQWVKDIEIRNDGTIITDYTNQDDRVETHKFKWPTNIKVNDNGTIETEFNNGDPVIQGPTMDWIKSASFDSEKNLLIDYVNADDVNVNLKTVNNIVFKNGDIYAIYNTGAEEVYIGSIDNATVNMIAGNKNIDTSNLRTGGLWFVTEEMEG